MNVELISKLESCVDSFEHVLKFILYTKNAKTMEYDGKHPQNEIIGTMWKMIMKVQPGYNTKSNIIFQNQ